jgi:hypothetical protein
LNWIDILQSFPLKDMNDMANLKGVPRYGRGFFAVDKTEF